MTQLHEAHTTFPLSVDAPRAARRWLHTTSVVPRELVDAVDLVVSELVSNSVAHSGLGRDDVVSVHIASSPGGVNGEVVDEGRGIGTAPKFRPRSLGLRIVGNTADRWGHTDHPTRVWFEFTTAGAHSSHRPAA
jgi:two-component sensor histidine kinase